MTAAWSQPLNPDNPPPHYLASVQNVHVNLGPEKLRSSGGVDTVVVKLYPEKGQMLAAL